MKHPYHSNPETHAGTASDGLVILAILAWGTVALYCGGCA